MKGLLLLMAGIVAASIWGQSLGDLRERAAGGDPEAMNYLGYLLISGSDSLAPDTAAGLEWIERAAEAGDVKAASNIGWLYLQGEIVEPDTVKAVGLLTEAAQKGLPVAMAILGDLYREGKAVERDSLAADSLYGEAFERGLGDAGYKLYELRKPSYATMTPADLARAGKYYYLRGAPSAGVKLFYEGAERGDATAKALLGDAYTRAIGVPYDYELSKKYYVEAAVEGNPSAQFVVGELLDIFPDALKGHEEWIGVPDNPDYWYEKAAEAGVTDAAVASDLLFQ